MYSTLESNDTNATPTPDIAVQLRSPELVERIRIRLNSLFNSSTTGLDKKQPSAPFAGEMQFLIFCGTRPEIIKMAPVVRAFKLANFSYKVVFTGQHRDMAEPFRRYWNIEFDTFISGVYQPGQTLSSLVGKLISSIETQVPFAKNSVWVVQGDTSTSLAAGMVAFFRGTPIIHLEAGLRTFNHAAPFPEELNRRTLSLLASLHIAPTLLSASRLETQGVERDRIFTLGNTGIDAARLAEPNMIQPAEISHINTRLILVTLHRRENAHRLEELYHIIGRQTPQNVTFVVPVHPNPTASRAAHAACQSYKHLHCVSPMGYGETQWMLANSILVLTDSGGLQEESTWYGRPVLVLRDDTERTEAIDAGSSILISDSAALERELVELCAVDSQRLQKMSIRTLPFGDGYTSERLIKLLKEPEIGLVLTRGIKMINFKAEEEAELRNSVIMQLQNTSSSSYTRDSRQHSRQLVCSEIRPSDRSGSVVHDMLFAWSYAEHLGMHYVGPVGNRGDLPEIETILKVIGVPWLLHDVCPTAGKMLRPEVYRNETYLLEKIPEMKALTAKQELLPTCVVHIRRGDVTETYPQTGDYFRWWPALFYLRMIDEYCDGNNVIIHAESLHNDEEKIFTEMNYELKLTSSIPDTIRDFVQSRVFIMSSSSFSYSAAVFAAGRVVYAPFWHKAAHGWQIPTRPVSTPWPDVEASFAIEKIPCEGGQFGSDVGPTMSVCVLTPETTLMFEHPPHAAQTMYNCFSLFQHHATDKCAFNFEGLDATDFAVWLAHRMGCAVQVSGERCMYASKFTRTLRVEPGDAFSWFNTVHDAQQLRSNVLRHLQNTSFMHQSRSPVGIINRKGNRKLLLPKIAMAGADISFMEDLNFDEQAIWWHSYDIIVAAHGASFWAANFAKKCTVIIQLYPEHYYPIFFYEKLITESGSIVVSWWPGAYIGDDEDLIRKSQREATKDFSEHHNQRDDHRSADIEISEVIWNELKLLANKRRQRCLDEQEEHDDDRIPSLHIQKDAIQNDAGVDVAVDNVCHHENDSTFSACTVAEKVDVVLTVFARENLALQLDAVYEQTREIANVWVVQNEEHVDVDGIIATWTDSKKNSSHVPRIETIKFSSNSRYHGRFYVAYFMSNAEYVSIWDDDVVVGRNWTHHCIAESKRNGDALVGANGRTILSILSEEGSDYSIQEEMEGRNDFVGHTWTLKREHLRLFLATPQLTYITGEDIQLSYALQLHGIISWRAPNVGDGFVRDSEFTSDRHASYTNKNFQEVRQWLICKLLERGFRPIRCANCTTANVRICVEQFESRAREAMQ